MSPGRTALLDIFRTALEAVSGRDRVARFLTDRELGGPVYLVAIGKAAADMAIGALDVLGEKIAAGLVITKQGHLDGLDGAPRAFGVIESAHPIPDDRSLEAGRRLVGFMTEAPADARFLFLISGGASSLVEVLPGGLDAVFLGRMNAWLLASGLPIEAMNRVRKACSMIKGGRLAAYLKGRPALNLLISDVPGDDPAVIGSGLLVAAELEPLPALPEWLTRSLPSRPSDVDSAGLHPRVETQVLATRADAVAAASARARSLGYAVFLAESALEGDALETGRTCAAQVLSGEPGVTIWSGETTVRLPPNPGRGGRNQALALAAAILLSGREDVCLLAAGTDGTDGPTGDAGAIVDGGTVARGSVEGLEAQDALARADSGTFLAASGDLVHTGPTGTNVMDLVIGLKAGPRAWATGDRKKS